MIFYSLFLSYYLCPHYFAMELKFPIIEKFKQLYQEIIIGFCMIIVMPVISWKKSIKMEY